MSEKRKILRDGRGKPIDEKASYYIQDTRQVVGNCALFWRPDGAGYTCDLLDAGVYPGAHAKGKRNTSKESMMSDVIEAGLWEENGVREVHGLGVRFKTPDELKARGYAFAFSYGSDALAKAFAWLRGESLPGAEVQS